MVLVRRIKNIVWDFLNLIGLGGCVQLMLLSELKDSGWFKSFKTKRSVDKNGNPIPWLTYSFIDFITKRLNKDMEIFEYGSGNSTIYFAKNVNTVTSVEHNLQWFEKISTNIPENVKIIFNDLENKEQYYRIAELSNRKYHIIIDDAEERVKCIIHSLDSLTKDGVFILDDSERSEYSQGTNYLIMKGFKKLDFWGMAPGIYFKKCTSVFYRQNNCLGI